MPGQLLKHLQNVSSWLPSPRVEFWIECPATPSCASENGASLQTTHTLEKAKGQHNFTCASGVITRVDRETRDRNKNIATDGSQICLQNCQIACSLSTSSNRRRNTTQDEDADYLLKTVEFHIRGAQAAMGVKHPPPENVPEVMGSGIAKNCQNSQECVHVLQEPSSPRSELTVSRRQAANLDRLVSGHPGDQSGVPGERWERQQKGQICSAGDFVSSGTNDALLDTWKTV